MKIHSYMLREKAEELARKKAAKAKDGEDEDQEDTSSSSDDPVDAFIKVCASRACPTCS
jgi:hypothetical protein